MYFFGIQIALWALYKTSCTYSMAYHIAYPDIENLKGAFTKIYIFCIKVAVWAMVNILAASALPVGGETGKK